VVGAFHRKSAAAVQPVMNIHAPSAIMHIAYSAVGPGANRAAASGKPLLAAPRSRTAVEC
jgi:hypothetical protein